MLPSRALEVSPEADTKSKRIFGVRDRTASIRFDEHDYPEYRAETHIGPFDLSSLVELIFNEDGVHGWWRCGNSLLPSFRKGGHRWGVCPKGILHHGT